MLMAPLALRATSPRRAWGGRSLLRPSNSPHLPAAAAATVEPVAAIGLEPRHAGAGRHLEPFQDLAGLRIDAPHVALVAFPGAVPQLAVGPGDAGDDAIGLDGAQDLSRFGIDLMDLTAAMLADPQRAFGPGHARIAAVAGSGNRRQHL